MTHERIACINCGEVIADNKGTSSPEVARLYKENRKLRESRDAMAHLIVENGIVPGEHEGSDCRCEECRSIAVSMAEAGYLDNVSDRWWEVT